MYWVQRNEVSAGKRCINFNSHEFYFVFLVFSLCTRASGLYRWTKTKNCEDIKQEGRSHQAYQKIPYQTPPLHASSLCYGFGWLFDRTTCNFYLHKSIYLWIHIHPFFQQRIFDLQTAICQSSIAVLKVIGFWYIRIYSHRGIWLNLTLCLMIWRTEDMG